MTERRGNNLAIEVGGHGTDSSTAGPMSPLMSNNGSRSAAFANGANAQPLTPNTPGPAASFKAVTPKGGESTPSALDGSAMGSRRKHMTKLQQRKLKEEKRIKISLYINGTPYEYGKICTFCENATATLHCPECPDFFCAPCDTTVHSHGKRKAHVRSKISKYTKDAAAKKCTYVVVYHHLLLKLQALARKKFVRYFDKETLCHYYVNTVYNTTSWRPPYCLRGKLLVPFMEPEYAAAKIQGLYRMTKARARARDLIHELHRKVFDRSKGIFYYTFSGKSTLVPRADWKPPAMCKLRGYYNHILPVFTEDVAALTIQWKWRSHVVRQMLKQLVRLNFLERWDPVRQKYKYLNLNTDKLSDEKPMLLGSEPFDSTDVTIWDVERVVLFIRRLGYKKYGYVEIIRKFKVDGQLLLFFTTDDFRGIGITNRIHIRRIQMELNSIFPASRRNIIANTFRIRREKLNGLKRINNAATVIQRYFRGYIGRLEAHNTKIKRMIDIKQALLAEESKIVGTWWLQHRLPPITSPTKDFGRRRDQYTTMGWGHWTSEGFVSIKDADEYLHSNPTRAFTVKLSENGYDMRRTGELQGTLAQHSDLTAQTLEEKAKALRLQEMIATSDPLGLNKKKQSKFNVNYIL